MNTPAAAELIQQRVLLITGVRRGILRHPGTLVVTPRKLLFLPDGDAATAALSGLTDAGEDELDGALRLLVGLASTGEGMDLPRSHPALKAPDDDGRLRLLALGEDDDLLIPVPDLPLLRLVMGPARRAASADRLSAEALLGRVSTGEGTEDEDGGGWIGPVSGGASALLSLMALPALVVVAIIVGEEADDEIGALLFLVGASALMLAHLGGIGGTVAAFVQRERNRWWGLAAPFFTMTSAVVALAGALVALDELF